MQTLQEIYLKHKVGHWSDKGSTHTYIEVYAQLFAPYRHTAKNILEIGLMSGESLRMWDEYFDGDAYGIDCTIKPFDGMADLTQAIADGLKISIGDAESPSDIEKFFSGIKFDVVVEDANHSVQQQLKIYETLKPYLNKGSIYIIEDIQDIDNNRAVFENMDNERHVEILDRRSIKNVYDDILVVITDKL
jgi:cephalosporin hydroxylase